MCVRALRKAFTSSFEKVGYGEYHYLRYRIRRLYMR